MNNFYIKGNEYQIKHKLSKKDLSKNNKLTKSPSLNKFNELELKEIEIKLENGPESSTFPEEEKDILENSSSNNNKDEINSNKFLGKKYTLKNKEKNGKTKINKKDNNKTCNGKNNLFLTKEIIKKTNKKKDKLLFKNEVVITNMKKIKMNSYLYHSILSKKHISEQTVINLDKKLHQFKSLILYTIINVKNLLEKVNIDNNNDAKKIYSDIINYEKCILVFYNEAFEIRKQYNHMLSKLKKDSIPCILQNISKLKDEITLEEEEKKELEEMKKSLNDFEIQIDEIKSKYETKINEYFLNSIKLFKALEELKNKYIKK